MDFKHSFSFQLYHVFLTRNFDPMAFSSFLLLVTVLDSPEQVTSVYSNGQF